MSMILWSLIAFIIAVTIIIIVHEFGHFIVARWCGVKVLRFSVGFGKPLLRYVTKKHTEFVIAAIPLGGYVKMLDENEGPVSATERSFAFNQKPVMARIAIASAGPIFNFLFAIVAFWLMFMIGITAVVPKIGEIQANSIAAKAAVAPNSVIRKIDGNFMHNWYEVRLALLAKLGEEELALTTEKNGQLKTYQLDIKDWHLPHKNPHPLSTLGIKPFIPTIPTVVGKVLPNSPAMLTGIKVDDKIIAINKQPIKNWQSFRKSVNALQGKNLNLSVIRNNKILQFKVTPEIKIIDDKRQKFIGVISKPIKYPQALISVERYNPWGAFTKSLARSWEIFKFTFVMLYKMAVGDISMGQIAGPVGIAQGAGITASLGFSYYLSFLALISISIGIINILPIPILDGGHILYYLIESVRRKPLSIQTQQFGMKIGLVLLIGLTLLAFYNDLSRILS